MDSLKFDKYVDLLNKTLLDSTVSRINFKLLREHETRNSLK